MNHEAVYEVNAPSVIHEFIEGEVLIVHLKGGAYFSLIDTASDIWNALMEGLSPKAVAMRLSTCYPEVSEAVMMHVETFVARLAEEDLIKLRTDVAAAAPSGEWTPMSPVFAPPEVNRYTDLEEHMKVDPVHDVTEAGWPMTPTKD